MPTNNVTDDRPMKIQSVARRHPQGPGAERLGHDGNQVLGGHAGERQAEDEALPLVQDLVQVVRFIFLEFLRKDVRDEVPEILLEDDVVAAAADVAARVRQEVVAAAVLAVEASLLAVRERREPEIVED